VREWRSGGVGEMRASHGVMALGTCGTDETGETNVYWKLLMCFAIGMIGKCTNTSLKANIS